MDPGVAEGNDTAYYLSKGFRVIAVEASPIVCEALRVRFSSEIASGHLKLLNFVASDAFGDVVTFLQHPDHPGISAMHKRPDVSDTYKESLVNTIDWNTLKAQSGVPRYLKIDIEGNEEAFLKGMVSRQDLPEFMSIEAYAWRPIERLLDLGYRRFKLIDQTQGFVLPARQLEGLTVEAPNFVHASGPFGLDVFADGGWRDPEEIRSDWTEASARMASTWFDCHAWMPN